MLFAVAAYLFAHLPLHTSCCWCYCCCCHVYRHKIQSRKQSNPLAYSHSLRLQFAATAASILRIWRQLLWKPSALPRQRSRVLFSSKWWAHTHTHTFIGNTLCLFARSNRMPCEMCDIRRLLYICLLWPQFLCDWLAKYECVCVCGLVRARV